MQSCGSTLARSRPWNRLGRSIRGWILIFQSLRRNPEVGGKSLLQTLEICAVRSSSQDGGTGGFLVPKFRVARELVLGASHQPTFSLKVSGPFACHNVNISSTFALSLGTFPNGF